MPRLSSKLLPLSIFAVLPLAASISQVATPGALGSNASLQWNSAGPAGTTFSGSVTGAAGSVTVTAASSSLERVDESYLWTGSFPLNDYLLWNVDSGNAMTFTFSTPVNGVGSYVQGDIFGPFTVTLTAYDGATVLGTFSVNGTNSGNEDGSAPFLGVLSTNTGITKIVLTESDGSGNNALAIDSLLLNTTPVSTPEPGAFGMSLFLLGCALLTKRWGKTAP